MSVKDDEGGESKLEGIAPDGPPASFACPELDAQRAVLDRQSLTAMARLAREEGILAGGSAGAALAGALAYARDGGWPAGARVVVILPDTGRNYVGSMAR